MARNSYNPHGIFISGTRGHGAYHPIGFEGREDTSKTLSFSCTGFAEAMGQATEETIGDIRKAMVSAMNKVLKSVKTLVSSEIRKRYNVPKAVLDARLDLFEGRVKDLQATLTIGGQSVSLSYFGAKQTNRNKVITRKGVTTRKRSAAFQGVETEVIKGRRTQLKSAFMQTFWSGHVGILIRTGKDRYPIRVKSAISIASMFDQVDVNAAIVAKIDADLDRTFMHELEFYLNRGGR